MDDFLEYARQKQRLNDSLLNLAMSIARIIGILCDGFSPRLIRTSACVVHLAYDSLRGNGVIYHDTGLVLERDILHASVMETQVKQFRF